MYQNHKEIISRIFNTLIVFTLCIGVLFTNTTIGSAQTSNPDNTDYGVDNYYTSSSATPKMWVSIAPNSVQGDNLLPESPVTLKIDGVILRTQTSDTSGHVFFYLGTSFNIRPCQVVVLQDGTNKIKHTVRNLSVTEYNLDKNTVTGKATPNGKVQVSGYESNGDFGDAIHVPVDSAGNWKVKFDDPLAFYDFGEDNIVVVFQNDAKGNTSVLETFVLSAPTLQEPSFAGTTATLSWLKTSKRGFFPTYKVQVAKDKAFSKLVVNAKVSDLSLDAMNLKPLKTYYWRVRELQELGPKSSWSMVGSFTVPAP